MASAMPIVASAVGGVPEIIDGRENGLLVPLNDEDKFVEYVVELIEDRKRARQIGDAARQYIRDEQSIEHATSQLQQLYSSLVFQKLGSAQG
jgi:glycosyltransferase involved in cell wall biosynthesis